MTPISRVFSRQLPSYKAIYITSMGHLAWPVEQISLSIVTRFHQFLCCLQDLLFGRLHQQTDLTTRIYILVACIWVIFFNFQPKKHIEANLLKGLLNLNHLLTWLSLLEICLFSKENSHALQRWHHVNIEDSSKQRFFPPKINQHCLIFFGGGFWGGKKNTLMWLKTKPTIRAWVFNLQMPEQNIFPKEII